MKVARQRHGRRAAVVVRALAALGLCLGLTALGGPSAAQPTGPFLRIEPGRHVASIRALTTNKDGTLLATASHDKTIRLWAPDQGRLLATFRIPIDRGDEGKLNAIALSPDGGRLIAAGDTRLNGGRGYALHVFDVAQQRYLGPLPNLPNVVNHMTHSADGRLLATALGGTGELLLWDAGRLRLLALDRDYGGQLYWVAFGADGRLATSAADGFVRLYAPYDPASGQRSIAAVARWQAPDGGQPYGLAFSPDGSLLAVGHLDRPRVDVLYADGLRPYATPDVSDLSSGGLAAVAWSWTGGQSVDLVAAGTMDAAGGGKLLRRWQRWGQGPAIDQVLPASDSINKLRSGPGGAVFFASADPSWGRVQPDGQVDIYVDRLTGDFRDIFEGRFALSGDGQVVEFGLELGGLRPHAYDLRTGTLRPAPYRSPAVTSPLTVARGLQVDQWKNAAAPLVNGRPLALDAGERTRSLAIRPDGSGFLLGSDFWLRLYDAQGRELRKVRVEGTPWGVNVARSAPVAVAALGDGTLRWYSLAPGRELEELAALFPHRDGRQWVLWTPEGFFDHSAGGGKDLVGFHLNESGRQAPRWVLFSQLYRVFFAPDLVRAKFRPQGAALIERRRQSIGDINALLTRGPSIEVTQYCYEPPVTRSARRRRLDSDATADSAVVAGGSACYPIDLSPLTRSARRRRIDPPGWTVVDGDQAAAVPALVVDLPDGVGEVVLRYRLRDAGGGLGSRELYRNGRNISEVAATRSARRRRLGTDDGATASASASAGPTLSSVEPGVEEQRVLLDPGRNLVQVRAYNASESVYQDSPVLAFVSGTPVTRSGGGQDAKPRLFVLAVGINDYRGDVARLNFARPDAQSFARTVTGAPAETYGTAGEGVVLRELYDAQATQANVLSALTEIADVSAPSDTVVVYLAGHGMVVPDPADPGSQFYHFLSYDVTDPDQVWGQGVSEQAMIRRISGVMAGNFMLFLDTCHSGGFSQSAPDQIRDRLGAGRYLLAASLATEEALDNFDGRNGVFARAVLDALEGIASPPFEREVDHISVGRFVSRYLTELYVRQRSSRHGQDALFSAPGGVQDIRGFPLTRKDEGFVDTWTRQMSERMRSN